MTDKLKAGKKTMVLGIGNIIMGDEGFGLHVIRRLKEIGMPENIILEEGGVGGFELLNGLQGIEKLVVVDIMIAVFIGRGAMAAESAGCYLTDAMLVGFHCQGFWASGIVSAWLNLPTWAIYGLIFAPYSFKAALLAVLVWLPVAVFIVASRKAAQHA